MKRRKLIHQKAMASDYERPHQMEKLKKRERMKGMTGTRQVDEIWLKRERKKEEEEISPLEMEGTGVCACWDQNSKNKEILP